MPRRRCSPTGLSVTAWARALGRGVRHIARTCTGRTYNVRPDTRDRSGQVSSLKYARRFFADACNDSSALSGGLRGSRRAERRVPPPARCERGRNAQQSVLPHSPEPPPPTGQAMKFPRRAQPRRLHPRRRHRNHRDARREPRGLQSRPPRPRRRGPRPRRLNRTASRCAPAPGTDAPGRERPAGTRPEGRPPFFGPAAGFSRPRGMSSACGSGDAAREPPPSCLRPVFRAHGVCPARAVAGTPPESRPLLACGRFFAPTGYVQRVR